MKKQKVRAIVEGLEARVLLANITGTVWHDINGDAQRQPNEPAMEGWELYLDGNRNGRYDGGEVTAVSGADGGYTFFGVGNGYHLVGQIVKPGWRQNHPSQNYPPLPAAAPGLGGTILGSIARASQRTPDDSGRWVVGLSAATIQTVLARTGASAPPSPHLPKTYVLQFPTRVGGAQARQQLAAMQGLAFFYPLVGRERGNRLIPDDPMFNEQWHLQNTGQSGGVAGADLRITPVWDQYQGAGIVVGVVDDGIELTHPDIAPNYSATHSYDFGDNDADPTPEFSDEAHGTAVAGVIAARGNNTLGVSGVAPQATLAGLRLDSFTDDVQSAGALSHLPNDIWIYNNSWGPPDDGERLEGPDPLTAAAIQNGVLSGRNGKGSIYVWSAGNGYDEFDNVNYDGFANSRYAIAVSAVDDRDRSASFAEEGAPILVSAYGEGYAAQSIVTTDLLGADGRNDGDYHPDFLGTSAAAPIVSGVVALMLEANPNLGWRDVQQILARSARKVHDAHSDWTQNGAGLWVNHQFGFGAVDAAAAVDMAKTWQNVGQEMQVGTRTIGVNRVVPDDNTTGVVSSVSINDLLLVESVEVIFTATHSYRGDLRVVLTSPEGTQSVLADVHFDSDNNYNQWSFTSRRHLGEISRGNWTLRVTDESGGVTGTWNDWQLNLYGTPITAQHVAQVASSDVTARDFANRGLPGVFAQESRFVFDASPQKLTFVFDQDVNQSISADDLEVKNAVTGEVLGPENFGFEYSADTRRATWTLLQGLFSEGDYLARLKSIQITNADGAMLDGNSDGAGGDDLVLPFFQLMGDANRDRTADGADFNILFAQFGHAGTWESGDFNLDGVVNFTDFQKLETVFGKTLGPAPLPALPVAAKKPVKRPAVTIAAKPVFGTKPIMRKRPVSSLINL